MVDLPTQDQTVTNGAPVRGQATAQISSSDMEKDNVTKQDSTVEPHTTPAPQQRDNGDLQAQPSQPEQQPSTNHTNTPGEFTSSKEAAQKDESKSRADSPMPSIETAQGVGNDQAGDPTNDFANADVGSLLPGLMDYANGADGATGEGLDLQNELTSGNLFSNDALQGTDGELGTGSGNLFGEGNLPADGAADDFDNQNAGFDFANMNFAVGDGSFGPDAEHGTSEEFDFSKLGQDFFNI